MSDTELQGDGRQGAFGRILGQAVPQEGVEQRLVEGALVRIHRQRRRRRIAVGGLAVAAAIVVGLCSVWVIRSRWEGGQPSFTKRPAPEKEVQPRQLTASARPTSYSVGPHTTRLSKGARVRLQSAAPTAARLFVQKGEAEFQVQPLVQGGSFWVQTQHVRVEVKGTRFFVESGERCSQVRVIEGEVQATAIATGESQLMGTGMERSFCAATLLSEELGEGGRMVRRALTLLSTGITTDLEQADRLLTQYLDRFPDGPFVEEALFYLVFARQRRGQGQQARALARRFLERFPETPRANRLRSWLEEKGTGSD